MSSTIPTSDEGRSARLALRGIALSVRLGCLPGEQDEPQPVEMDLVVHFQRPPEAVRTDVLEDTLDYGALVACVAETAEGRPFDLVEHLAGEVFDALRERIPPEHRLELTVRKVSPPVPELTGGAVFTLEG